MEAPQPTSAKVTSCGRAFAAILATWLSGWCIAQDAAVERPKPAFVPKITISKETTWATEPIDENGFVDYVAVVNRWFRAGVTPENNAVVQLYRALGPRPDGTRQPEEFFRQLGMVVPPDDGPYFSPHQALLPNWVLTAPWTTENFPWLADWLHSQEEPLWHIVSAAERSEYFLPLVIGPDEPMANVLQPGVLATRRLARRLIARGMWQLGGGDRFDAWRDLLAAHRMGRLLGRGPTGFVGLVGASLESEAINAELRWLAETQPSAKQIALLRRQLQRMPSRGSFAERFDACERLIYLDSCIRLARRRLTFEDVVPDGPAFENLPLSRFVEEALIQGIDWDEVLRSLNRGFDRLTISSQLPTAQERREALRRFNDELSNLSQERKQKYAWLVVLADSSTRTRFTAELLASRYFPHVQLHLRFEECVVQKMRNLEIALALAAWRSEHDSYPKTLAELAPKYLDMVPNDFFTDQPMRYTLTADGYRFYSFGPNGADDQGRSEIDTPRGDDLAVGMPPTKPK